MVVGAFLNAKVYGGESTSVSVGPNSGCVPVDTSTLKLVEVQNRRFESERDSPLKAVRSLLFIEVGECRAVVRHMCVRQK